MATAHQRGAGWVLARPLRQPRRGQHHNPQRPSTKGPSPLLMIRRRSPASSSFVLAAARLRALQLDPWPPGEKTRAATRKDPEEQSAQPGGARSHRARFVCLLDTGGPYGCRDEVRRITVCLERSRCKDGNVRAARQGIVDARGVGPSGGYRSQHVVESLGQSACVPAVLLGMRLLADHRLRRADRVDLRGRSPDHLLSIVAWVRRLVLAVRERARATDGSTPPALCGGAGQRSQYDSAKRVH